MTTTSDTLIPDEKVREALLAVIAENPNRTNNDVCTYTLDGVTPHCVVGHVLHRLGLPLPDPESLDNTAVVAKLDLPVSDESLSLLYMAQDAADLDHPWGRLPSLLEI